MKKTSSQNIHIVAVGAATSVGGYTDATIAAVETHIANFSEHPYMVDLQGVPYVLALAPYIDFTFLSAKRFNTLLHYALSDCYAQKEWLPSELPLVLCLPSARPGIETDQSHCIARQLVIEYPALKLTSEDIYCQGHAAAYTALEQVEHHLLQTKSEFCILAGVDSYLDSDTLNWLEIHSQLHSAANAYGFVPGEGAACVVLCTQITLDKHQLKSLGTLLSFSHSYEPVFHSQGVCIGQGLTEAVNSTLAKCRSVPSIKHVICDLNGEPHRTDEYGFMSARLSQFFRAPNELTTPADCWGDVGAASGVLAMVLAVSIPRAADPHSPTLLWSSSVHDLRGAMLIA